MAGFGGVSGPTSGAGGGYRAVPGKPGQVIGVQGVVKSRAQAGLAKVNPKPGPGSGGLRNTPTFNFTNPMNDQQLQSAAGSIAGAQTVGPLDQLARKIASNNAQTAGAQKATSGYYQGLGNQVQQSNDQIKGISSGLNQQLGQIGQDTQSTLAKAYAPGAELVGLDKQGLGGGGTQSLAQGLARAQGTAATNSQTAQQFGATQGANAETLGAQNLGTFALKGQEGLTSIGRAGQLRNVPLADKQAGLIANRGNLYATALGSLKSAERNYGLSRATLGIKAQAANTQAAAQQSNAQHQRATEAQARVNSNQTKLRDALAHGDRQAALGLRQQILRDQKIAGTGPFATPKGSKAPSGPKAATGEGQASDLATDLTHGTGNYAQVGRATTAKEQARGWGPKLTAENVTQLLQGEGKLTPVEMQAALELHTLGSVQPQTYQALVLQQHGKLNMPAINQGTRVPVVAGNPGRT